MKGLGKQGQGIKAPLVAEKNEYGAAVIKVGEGQYYITITIYGNITYN